MPLALTDPDSSEGVPAYAPRLRDHLPDYLGELNPNTGVITRVAVHGPTAEVQGKLFVP